MIGPRYAGLFAVALAGLILCGWGLDVDLLRRVVPTARPTVPLVAVCLALCGLALMLTTFPGRAARVAVIACIAPVLGVVAATAVQNARDTDWGLDLLLFPQSVVAEYGTPFPRPGRPAGVLLVVFALFGAALLLVEAKQRVTEQLFVACASLGAAIVFSLLLGYAFGLQSIYAMGLFAPAGLPGCIGLGVLALGLLARRADLSWMRHFSGEGVDAVMGRRTLLLVGGSLLVIAALVQLGADAQWYGRDLQVTVVTAAGVLLLLVAIVSQATQMHRLDQARRGLDDALRASHDRFHALADGAPVLLWVHGLRGCEFVNRSYREFVGVEDEGALLGDRWTQYLHADDRAAYLASYREALDRRLPFEVTGRFRRHDGAYRWMRSSATPRSDDAGRFLGYVGCTVDITDLEQAYRQLAEADRRKHEFLAVLSHELRNPLAPLRNALEIIRLAGGANPALAPTIEMMKRQMQHLVRLVDDLLDASRLSSGRFELRRRRVHLEDVVARAVELVRAAIDARRHALDVNIADLGLLVEGDDERLVQALSNILSNAAKYTEPGGRISVSLARDGEAAAIAVTDTGIGIPEPMLEGVFDMFVQLRGEPDRADPGLGVGLALARGIVERHGGTVDARSEGQGRGSVFIIRLPLLHIDPNACPDAVGTATTQGRVTRTRRVLIAEDNADTAASLALLLRAAGHEVHTAETGEVALRLADELRPDVLIVDIGLPDLDGLSVARQLRRSQWGRALRVVAVTGRDADADRRRSREAGVDLHLAKPADPRVIEEFLAGRR